jgi:hypothetical protein
MESCTPVCFMSHRCTASMMVDKVQIYLSLWAHLVLLHAISSSFCNPMTHLPGSVPPWQVFQVFPSKLQVFLFSVNPGASKEVRSFSI